MYQNLYDPSILLLELQPKESIVHISTSLPPILLPSPSSQLHIFSNKVSTILNLHFLLPASLNLPQHLTQFTTFFIQNNIFFSCFLWLCTLSPPAILSTYCCHHLRQATLNDKNSLALYPGPSSYCPWGIASSPMILITV